jgi:2-oxoglutarate dehydrogenase complex dihydrolipoamide succinyltransferase (E2) component
MRIEIVMPQMGQSVAEGTVVAWLKKVGETVAKDESLVAISTDKVDVEIPSPASGVLAEILVREGQVVPVGAVLAYLGEGVRPGAVEAVPGRSREAAWHSPSVVQLAKEHAVDLSQVRGTGSEGRITRQDILAFIDARTAAPAQPAARDVRAPEPATEDVVLPIPRLRKAIAEHMVRSKQTAPHVTQVHEIDMTAIARYREANHEAFSRNTGVALTYLPFVLAATARALQAFPLFNASYTDDGIVMRTSINIGIAVALDDGLIVPVLRSADRKDFVTVAREAADLATKARERRLTPDEVGQGTFTVNNFGAFGALIGTPIIVQPQAAILGLGKVVKRPVVIDDAIAIRWMAHLCLSYDHRLIDGAYAGAFLNHIQRDLEQFDFSMARPPSDE